MNKRTSFLGGMLLAAVVAPGAWGDGANGTPGPEAPVLAQAPDGGGMQELFFPEAGEAAAEEPESGAAEGGMEELFFPEAGGAAAEEPGAGAPAGGMDDLFLPAEPEGEELAPAGNESIDQLLGLEEPLDMTAGAGRISGFYQSELAYAYRGDEHWQKFRNLFQVAASGRLEGGSRWYASGRVVYDPIYDLDDFYSDEVRDDQRLYAQIRETYLDVPAGDWDLRLGRQHVIWGEMVGLFFADVVSAKDFREFVLPDFDVLRIPQWAVRAEYFGEDFYGDLVFIPVMTYDDIGEPGWDYFPFPADQILPASVTNAFDVAIDPDSEPADSLENAGFGGRISAIRNGWDRSVFFYSAPDSVPAFERKAPVPRGPSQRPVLEFERFHERVHQVGGTIAKDFGKMVFKGEVVYAVDRPFNVTTPTDADGLVELDTLDYVLGFNFSYLNDSNLNLQFFQRIYTEFDDDIAVPATDEVESGFSVFYRTGALHPDIEPEVLFISGLNRTDWLLQAKLTWDVATDWRLAAGVDVFNGPDNGLFGRFDDADRVFTEVRFSF